MYWNSSKLTVANGASSLSMNAGVDFFFKHPGHAFNKFGCLRIAQIDVFIFRKQWPEKVFGDARHLALAEPVLGPVDEP